MFEFGIAAVDKISGSVTFLELVVTKAVRLEAMAMAETETKAETKAENMIDPSCDWVEIVDPKHVLRKDIDQLFQFGIDDWAPVSGSAGRKRGDLSGWKFRCLRRDHPDCQKTEPMKQKPPLGVMPRRIWLENRLEELRAAISRYEAENRKVAVEWRIEEATISRELIDQPQPQQPLRWVENCKPDKPGIWAVLTRGGIMYVDAFTENDAPSLDKADYATRCYLGPIPEILPPKKKVVERLWLLKVRDITRSNCAEYSEHWLGYDEQPTESGDWIRTDRTREVER